MLLLAATGGLTLRLLDASLENQGWVTHTLEVQLELARLGNDIAASYSLALDASAAGSTPDPLAMEAGTARVLRRENALQRLVADNPAQLRRLATLRERLLPHLDAWRTLAGPSPSPLAVWVAGTARSRDELAAGVDQMARVESELLAERTAALQRSVRLQEVAALLSALLGAAALAVALHRLVVEARRTAALVDQLEARDAALLKANATLESKVQQRTAQLSRIARKLIQVEEDGRRTLARELHDDLAQRLAALKLNLTLVHRGAREGTALLEDALAIVDTAIDQVRDRAVSLRPPQLEELGLEAALRDHAAAQARRYGIPVHVEGLLAEAHIQLPHEWSTQVFRIAQEAVRNALVHGRPREVVVRVVADEVGLELEVRDDGAGFDAARVAPGMGLDNMRERTELLGGRCSIDATPGGGCRVRCRWPRQAVAEADTPLAALAA